MKKVIALVLAIGLLFANTAVAGVISTIEESIKDKLSISSLYEYSTKEFDNLSIKGSIPGFGLNIETKLEDVKLNQMLFEVAYKINESIIPYAQLGTTWMSLRQKVDGSLSTPWYTEYAPAIDIEGQEAAFTYALGAKGNIAEYKNFKLDYDVRRLAFNSEYNSDFTFMPTLIGMPMTSNSDVNYTQYDIAVKLSREIIIEKFIKTITPMIGYQYSNVNIDAKNSYDYQNLLNISTDYSYNKNFNSLLLGVSAKINDRITANVEGSLFGNTGVSAKVTFSF